MKSNLPSFSIAVTQPQGQPAKLLAEQGVAITALDADWGNVDWYILSDRVAVARRTGNTLLQGIQDKTLFTSAIYLRETFDVPVLMLEGDVDYTYTAFNPQAVRGAVSALLVQYGMSVVSTPDLEETVALLSMFTRHAQQGVPEISLVPKRKAVDLADLQRRVVEMLPGCGRVLARDLLRHFGSVRHIANATTADLRAVKGIGAKKAANIQQVFEADYEAVDTEKDLEDALEASPGLLFDHPVTLVARQHFIYTEGGERYIVDLVFWNADLNTLILVELKRGKLSRDHEAQLRRYLDNAHQSPLLMSFLESGAALRGVLATVEPCDFEPQSRPGHADIDVAIVDKQQVIDVLKTLR